MATQIEMLAAVLAGSKRRPVFALVTEVYPMIDSDSLTASLSINIPIDGTGDYLDSQQASFSDFFMEVLNIVVTQDQAPDVLLSNMTTGVCDVSILTITEVDQEQLPDTLLSNMTTDACNVDIITITEVEQAQLPDTLLSNMTTDICSVLIT